MNRREFMDEFKKRLHKLPFDETKEAVDYYEQYFDDAGEENEQAVLAELGPPANIASQIIADHAIKGADEGKSVKRGLSAVWLVILAVFASPIALPLALAVVIIALSLVVILLALILSVGAAALGLVVGGIALTILSIPIFIQSFATGLYALGAGLVMAGIGAALSIATVPISKKCFTWLAKHMGKFILRRNKK